MQYQGLRVKEPLSSLESDTTEGDSPVNGAPHDNSLMCLIRVGLFGSIA